MSTAINEVASHSWMVVPLERGSMAIRKAMKIIMSRTSFVFVQFFVLFWLSIVFFPLNIFNCIEQNESEVRKLRGNCEDFAKESLAPSHKS